MEQTILLGKYEISWRNQSVSSFISEIFHFIKNNAGGIIKTPIGIALGFLNTHPSYWTIKIILRDDILYISSKNQVTVVVKSAYKNKLKYHFDKRKLKANGLPIDPSFQNEFVKYLMKERICFEPLTIEIGTETIKQSEEFGNLTLEDFD